MGDEEGDDDEEDDDDADENGQLDGDGGKDGDVAVATVVRRTHADRTDRVPRKTSAPVRHFPS